MTAPTHLHRAEVGRLTAYRVRFDVLVSLRKASDRPVTESYARGDWSASSPIETPGQHIEAEPPKPVQSRPMSLRVPALRMTLGSVAHDPGYTSLRRGLRAGVVVPPLLGAATLLGLGQSISTFLVFGVMALLVFADFGGTSRSRVTAYVTAALAGMPLIVIGTLASGSVWIAVAASAIVGFALSGVGVLGGYFLNAQTALMLAFVLAVTNVASIDALAARVVGWAAAGAVAVLAGWLIWPRSSHVALRGVAASVIRTVAATIAAPGRGKSGESPRLEAAARQELAMLNRGFVIAQRRPSGATRRDRALAELATELDRAVTYVASAASADSVAATEEAARLREAVVRALRASADLLEGGGDTHDIEPLVEARDGHRAALDRWVAEQLQAGATPEHVLDGLTAAHPIRLMSSMALAIAQNAEVIAGFPTTGPSRVASRGGVWNTFMEELAPSSIWLRNSLRTALGIALAVLVARSLAVPYAFWVVLGTLSALRSNISATGRTAFLALGGTALGVLIAVPFVGVTGAEPWVLWIVLPILVFLAAYAPAAVNFVVGQVAFSVLVVVLFNILAPTDWQLGLVRVENVGLGLAVSVVVGLLLWPRGARGQLRSALADLYDAGASLLSFSFRRLLTDAGEPADAVDTARSTAWTRAIRAQEVFEQFLNERTRQAPGIDVWATLLSSGKGLMLISDVIDWLFEHGYSAARSGAPASTVGNVASNAIGNILRLAEEIRSGHPLRVAGAHDFAAELRSAALATLSQPELATSPAALRSAIGLVSTADWLGQLDSLLQDLDKPVAETLAANATHWRR